MRGFIVERIPIAPKIKSVFSSFSHRRGFTLAELITTMAIVAILAGMVLPRFLSQSEKAATAEAISTLGVLKRAQIQYFDENNAFWAPSAGGAQINVCTNKVAAQNALGINFTDICVTSGARWNYFIDGVESTTSIVFTAVRTTTAGGSIILTQSLAGTAPPTWSGTGLYAQGQRFWPFGS